MRGNLPPAGGRGPPSWVSALFSILPCGPGDLGAPGPPCQSFDGGCGGYVPGVTEAGPGKPREAGALAGEAGLSQGPGRLVFGTLLGILSPSLWWEGPGAEQNISGSESVTLAFESRSIWVPSSATSLLAWSH